MSDEKTQAVTNAKELEDVEFGSSLVFVKKEDQTKNANQRESLHGNGNINGMLLFCDPLL